MDDRPDPQPPVTRSEPESASPVSATAPDAEAPAEPPAREGSSRRAFLQRSARKLAYVAPVVLLFHPKPACASNGSTLTWWDGSAIQQKPHTPGTDP